ncbi:reverse transcriptase domain-containing protein [Clostridium sp.]|uniref:reverse transcriptase domain-containing protein n=1 Tax=Clostridium sp. TaxID=1506 RepID=UPI001A63D348|nr:reverse transcriptase domain-containing protein [Clostridium sp.]MBK5240327.1 hypothetical protein [Clostridium sp.]
MKTVKRDEYKEFFYKDFECFELFFEKNIDQLIINIREYIYIPQNCEKYYMPKKKNLARPISLLCLIDQIVYQALANIIADIFYPIMLKYFNANTFGNVFKATTNKNSIFFYERWKTQWKKFNDIKRASYYVGYHYTAEFDIASFYDTIDHNILCEILKEYGIQDDLIEMLRWCLSQWTVSPTANFKFKKSNGIPQGPISSSFISEIYLFKIDEELRKHKNIKYFRYADDINIMAKSQIECQKIVVYLDLLGRDLSLIPQSEKIGIVYIENIDKHINTVSAKFSNIAKEYQKNNNKLKTKTHTKLKKQLIDCIKNTDLNKTIISFALFKLDKDDDIKNILLQNLNKLELFYKGIIYYFDKNYPSDDTFIKYISSYLLGDTVLYQYNKSLLFKSYRSLKFDEKVFHSNYKNEKRFWIVKYQLINWLKNNEQFDLIMQFDEKNNYYIQREVNFIKYESYKTDYSKQVFLKSLICSNDVMTSLHGLNMWYKEFSHKPIIDNCNDYIKKIINDEEYDYLQYIMVTEFNVEVPDNFLVLCKETQIVYKEIKDDLRIYINKKNINPNESLMALDLFHNILFDIISKDKEYTTGDFGSVLDQMASEFPIAYHSFKAVHEIRNQKTLAHYKDKNGKPRLKICQSEFDNFIQSIKLHEAYDEIFIHYGEILAEAVKDSGGLIAAQQVAISQDKEE